MGCDQVDRIEKLLSVFSRYIHCYIQDRFPYAVRKIDVFFQHAVQEAESAFPVDKKRLWRSINSYRYGTEDFLLVKPFDLRVRTSKCSMLGPLELFSREGLCNGMCEWFAYRYFMTRERFSTSRECIQSLAKYFEHGAAHGSIFLQSIVIGSAKEAILQVLGMERTEQWVIRTKAFDTEKDHCFDNVRDGVYFLSLFEKHKILFVRTEEADYLFDPSSGCDELSKEEFSSELVKRIEKSIPRLDPRGESYLDLRQVHWQPDKTQSITVQVE